MSYPRELRTIEKELILFVLPQESPAYGNYRQTIAKMVVLGDGRRGKGNIVLGRQGDVPDINSPLAPVIAYGLVETIRDTFTITVRENIGEQIDVEIVSSRGEEIPDLVEVTHRWTYSTWRPGAPSPATQTPVREVRINGELVLAFAQQEKRIWLYDSINRINHLIPITNYYNELMLHKHIRDPKIALNSTLFFIEMEKYTDADLRAAFVAYNRIKKRVVLTDEAVEDGDKGLKGRLRKLLKKA